MNATGNDNDDVIGNSGKNNGNNGGGGKNWDHEYGEDGEMVPLPEDLSWGLRNGTLDEGVLMRWKESVRGGGLMSLLMNWGEFRRRMLADERFFFKLMSQIVIGNGTSLMGEIQVRGKDIADEAEYVAADLIVGTVVEAAFVWILAPMIRKAPRGGVGGGKRVVEKFLNSLPANAFEVAAKGKSFSIAQRIASFFYAGAQYAAVGLGAGVVGMGITYALIESRKALDKSFEPKRPMPDLWGSSVGWAAFMAISSNTRFQIVEGLETALARSLAGKADMALKASIIALRFGNNYWGGVQFVQFFRYLGLHATEETPVG